MKTRCPSCSTTYQIDENALSNADGMARCNRCDTVFNAFENKMLEQPKVLSDENIISTEIEKDSRQTELAFDEDSDEVIEKTKNEDPLDDSGFLDSSPIDDDDGDFEGVDQDSVFLLVDNLENAANDDESPYKVASELSPFEVHEEEITQRIAERKSEALASAPPETIEASPPQAELLEEIVTPPVEHTNKAAPPISAPLPPSHSQTMSTPEYELQQQLDQPKPSMLIGWLETSVAAILLVVLLVQIGFIQKDSLKHSWAGQTVCEWFGQDCSYPMQRAPSRFQVVKRRIVPDPNIPDVLAMAISVRNSAPFAQVLPDLQLALYDIEDNLVARRRLKPQDYMASEPTNDKLVKSQEVISIDLVFEDPGTHVTGFRISFL